MWHIFIIHISLKFTLSKLTKGHLRPLTTIYPYCLSWFIFLLLLVRFFLWLLVCTFVWLHRVVYLCACMSGCVCVSVCLYYFIFRQTNDGNESAVVTGWWMNTFAMKFPSSYPCTDLICHSYGLALHPVTHITYTPTNPPMSSITIPLSEPGVVFLSFIPHVSTPVNHGFLWVSMHSVCGCVCMSCCRLWGMKEGKGSRQPNM